MNVKELEELFKPSKEDSELNSLDLKIGDKFYFQYGSGCQYSGYQRHIYCVTSDGVAKAMCICGFQELLISEWLHLNIKKTT